MCSSVRKVVSSVGNAIGGAISSVTNFLGLTSSPSSSGPTVPQVSDLPAAPTPRDTVNANNEDTTAMREARDAKKRAASLAGGRSSTLLTGAQGLRQAASTARKTLLGE